MKRCYFILLVVLISCKQESDLILGLTMGADEIGWKAEVSNLLEKNIIIQSNKGTYWSYLKLGDDSIKVEYIINDPYPTIDHHYFSNYPLYRNTTLRCIEINLKGDTACHVGGEWKDNQFIADFKKKKKNVIEGYYPRSKKTIDRIREYMIERYGIPHFNSDSLENQYRLDLYSNDPSPFFMLKYADTKFKDVWRFDDYNVELFRVPYNFNSCFRDTIYQSAHIVYKSINHDEEVHEIAERIRSNFRPDDLIEIKFKQPSFSRKKGGINELSQTIEMISRKGPEENRRITDILFDVLYLNRFKEEVAKIENCTYEIVGGLGPGLSLDLLHSKGGYKISYNGYTQKGIHYEKVRNNLYDYDYKGKGEIIAQIKKVVFEDGSVLE